MLTKGLESVKCKVRERLKAYLGKVSVYAIEEGRPAAVVLAPVESGLSKFISVDGLPDVSELPFIPERLRDFAFRYATEYKPHRVFADIYGVGVPTIERWLRKPGVCAYIALCRYEQRMFNLAQRACLQRDVMRTIQAILSTKINASNIESIGKMARFVWNVLHSPEDAGGREKGRLNVNIGVNNLQSTNTSSPYRQEREITPKDIESIEAEIAELELLEAVVYEN